MELAEQVARLADVAERIVKRDEREERERRAAQLFATWGGQIDQAGVALYLRSIPGLAAHFVNTVPSEFVAQTDDGELVIACPCGGEPIVHVGELSSCTCGRWFLHDGSVVHVALSPTPAVPDSDQSGTADG